MDDSALYTGVDGIDEGQFGNEVVDDQTKDLLEKQRKQIAEITPQLEGIISMIEAERKVVLDFITGYVDTTKDDDESFRSELKAAGRYRKYLDELKTKFTLQLQETKK